MTLAATVLLQKSVDHGFGTNLVALAETGPQDLKVVLKAIAIEIPLVTISTGFARCAFGLYILAILGRNPKYQIPLWTVMILQLAGNIVSGVLPLSICSNVRMLWDPTAQGTCGDNAAVIKFAYFSSGKFQVSQKIRYHLTDFPAVNSASDFFLAVFPTSIFWSLNLRLGIKISLITLMSLGLLAMVASIIKTTKYGDIPSITNLGSTGGIELIRWGYAENLIIIITSSVPCIRPLLISSVRKISSAAKSYELSGPFSSSKGPSRPSRYNYAGTPSENRDVEQDLPDETDSIERILRNAEDEERKQELRRGITKQVEVSVMSAHSHSQGSGSR